MWWKYRLGGWGGLRGFEVGEGGQSAQAAGEEGESREASVSFLPADLCMRSEALSHSVDHLLHVEHDCKFLAPSSF